MFAYTVYFLSLAQGKTGIEAGRKDEKDERNEDKKRAKSKC